MKFYDRDSEINALLKLYGQTKEGAKMSVLTGRRRVGKTLLSLEFVRNHKFVYLFVSKKSESLLCIEYLEEIRRVFDVPIIGEIRKFKDIFHRICVSPRFDS